MDLVKYIYHEKQEPGSLLCAQHCLNNLLQQPVYTEIDLAELASKLDLAENAAQYRQPSHKSYNYDDTGFFSISVLEKALQVWDLTLVRWRGEAMRQYQDHPEDQAAFILNLQNHWFTLRRFQFNSRWYNLNSFLPQPEWISPTYLQLVLAQAEAEGYSVFVVRKAGAGAGDTAEVDPGEAKGWGDGGVAVFPSSGAELMVEEMGHATGRNAKSADQPSVDDTEPSAVAGPSRHAGAVDDDVPSDPVPSYSSGSGRRRRRQEDPPTEHIDEQDLLPGAGEPASSSSRGKRKEKSKWREDLDHTQYAHVDEELDDEEEHDLYHDSVDYGLGGGPTDFKYHNRSYDDEDEALQAALKASMADLPPDFEMPELKPLHPPPVKKATRETDPTEASSRAPRAPPVPEAPARWRPAEESSQEALQDAPTSSVTEEEDEEPVQELSPEQIRLVRLARFQQEAKAREEARSAEEGQ